MSMPSCIRPQRIPKPLTTGPLTGQIRPLEEGVELWLDEPDDWSCAVTCLLAACSPATSCRYSALLSWTEASRDFFLPRTAARPFSLIRRRCFSARTSDVRTAIVRVTVSTFFFVTPVLARAECHRSLAPSTDVVMTASCEPMLRT